MYVTVSHVDSLGVVAFDNPTRRNALTAALVEECLAALAQLRAGGARAVILRAAGSPAVWSAGHDISELSEGVDPLADTDPLERLLCEIKQFPSPVIAMIHGTVWGGATELALTCDLAVADPSCTFAITPAKLGLAYNTGGLQNLLSRVPLNVLRELIFTARPIGAQQALQCGLLNHVVPADGLERFTLEIANQIARQSPAEIALVKQQLAALEQASAVTPATLERLEQLRREVYSGPDFREGLKAFRAKRAPEFTGVENVGAGTASG